jgi:hypothetical protein
MSLVTLLLVPAVVALAADSSGPVAKVQRLLEDVQETIKKNDADETIVLSALETFHQQLEGSLGKEVDALKKTLGTLESAQSTQSGEVESQRKELRQLHDAADGSSAIASNYETGTQRVATKFEGVLMSMKALIALLKTSVVTPDGTLVTQEEPDSHGGSSQVLSAVRKVLSSHESLVSPPLLKVFCSNSTAQPALTPDLLADLVSALQTIENTVDGKRVEALAQFESKHQKYMADAQMTAAEQEKKEGLMAEGKRHFQEVVYAVDFTKAVVAKDVQMIQQLQTFSAAERKIQADLKVVRGKQQTTLRNLIDLLAGKFKALAAGATDAAPAYAAPETQHLEWLWEQHKAPTSFLQTRATPAKGALVGIRSQIEDALNNKQDTHAILMKIQAALHGQEGSAPDVENVRQVLSGMQNLLTELKEEKISESAAKQKCDEQMYRLAEGQAAADASLSLLGAAQDHLGITSNAARTNLGGIEKKRQALADLRREYGKIRNQTAQTAGSQAKDRSTVILALKKAHTVCQRVLPSEESGALTMLEQLVSLFQNVGELEQLHARSEDELQSALMAYISDYEQLLADRKMHYQESLAQLSLTSEELDADRSASSTSSTQLTAVKSAEEQYCTALLQHYQARAARRDRLLQLFGQVIPKVPDILNLQRGDLSP